MLRNKITKLNQLRKQNNGCFKMLYTKVMNRRFLSSNTWVVWFPLLSHVSFVFPYVTHSFASFLYFVNISWVQYICTYLWIFKHNFFMFDRRQNMQRILHVFSLSYGKNVAFSLMASVEITKCTKYQNGWHNVFRKFSFYCFIFTATSDLYL